MISRILLSSQNSKTPQPFSLSADDFSADLTSLRKQTQSEENFLIFWATVTCQGMKRGWGYKGFSDDRLWFWAWWKELGKVWKINRLRCVKAPELKIYNVGYSRSLSFSWWLGLSWGYLRGRGMTGSSDIIHQELHLGHCRGEMGRIVFVCWGWRQWSCRSSVGSEWGSGESRVVGFEGGWRTKHSPSNKY